MQNKFFEYDNNINKRIKVFGINLSEIAILIVGVFGAVLLGGLLSTLGVPALPFFLGVIVLFIISLILLKRTNKKDHPSYLLSFISYRIFQPKKIKTRGLKLPIHKSKESHDR